MSNVNNVNREFNNNVDNVIEKKLEELMSLLNEKRDKPRAIADTIAKKLGDNENLNFHIKMVKNHKPEFLFECLSLALDAYKRGKVKSLPKYYVGILKRREGL